MIDVAIGVILREGDFLVVRKGDGPWGFPGGKVRTDKGETLTQGLQREIYEETRLEFGEDRFLHINSQESDCGDYMVHAFMVLSGDNDLPEIIPEKGGEYKFAGIDDLLVDNPYSRVNHNVFVEASRLSNPQGVVGLAAALKSIALIPLQLTLEDYYEKQKLIEGRGEE